MLSRSKLRPSQGAPPFEGRRGGQAPGRDEAVAAYRALSERIRPEVESRLARRFQAKLRGARRHGPAVAAMIEAARDLTLRGGKRLRAVLVAAAYAGVAPRASLEPALEGGVAIELLQSYLLIQDDLMDGDETRRGGPSVHAALRPALGGVKLGESAAILASDFTWHLAIEALLGAGAPRARVDAALAALLEAHQDVVFGQLLDVAGRSEDVEAMHALKTGSYTARGPLLIGAALAGADEGVRRALARYAAPLGVAFQLRDDLLGTFGRPEETGKPVGNDLRAGKRTALVAEAERLLDPPGRAALDRVFGRGAAEPGEVREASLALVRCGVLDAVERRAAALVRKAASAAASLPLAAPSRLALVGVAHALAWNRPEALRPPIASEVLA